MVTLHFISPVGQTVKPVALAAHATQVSTISHAFHHFFLLQNLQKKSADSMAM
jgi:hypothetical protein